MHSGTPALKREFTYGQILQTLVILGGIAAGIWQGGEIRQTLEDGIAQEVQIRAAQTKALGERLDLNQQAANSRMDMLQDALKSVSQDVREMRSYIMVKKEFPGR